MVKLGQVICRLKMEVPLPVNAAGGDKNMNVFLHV